MRAVKSVLVMAGNLKRSEPDTSEDVVLIRAMKDSNVPKFIEADLPLFEAIVKDLFPGVTITSVPNPELIEKIGNIIESKNLKGSLAFEEKIVQLHETLKVSKIYKL